MNGIDQLPPHSPVAEKAALACVVEAGNSGSQNEAEEQLRQLRPPLFYELRHRHFHAQLVAMRMAGHSIDSVTIQSWLGTHKKWEEVGGLDYWMEVLNSQVLPGLGFSFMAFPDYLKTLKSMALRRWALAESVRLSQEAQAGEIDVTKLRSEFSEALEKIDKATDRERPLLEVVTIAEAKAYVPEPKSFLVGNDMISMGELTVIAGLPGLGKSRLANTLAFAGANFGTNGAGDWMGYAVRRQFRTLVLQSENSMRRIQSEVKDLPDAVGEFIRFSKPTALMFSAPAFRQAVRRYYDTWPFDVIIIDPWSDVVRDEKFSDYQEGLENVMASLPAGDKRPAIIIVAHLKKTVLGEKRMSGRQLMGQVSGSMRLMQKARTAFMLQPATDDMTDDRVIFDCGKSNNDQPLPMSAWFRRNGQFLPCPGFDFDDWLSPNEETRKAITADVMKQLLKDGRQAAKKVLVEELKQMGFSQPTAYRALDADKGKFFGFLSEKGGLLSWKG